MNNIMNELEKKLISMSENDYGYALPSNDDGIKEPLELDPYAEKIFQQGLLFKPEKMFCLDMPLGQCHQNVANVFANNENEEGDKLYTGYTQQYQGGGWMQHSWIVDKEGFIVESTSSDTYPQYFGIELKDEDLGLFLENWSDQNKKNEIQDFLKSKNNINKNIIKP
jgi:hypothetical protein